jgi:hypothetical protein
MNTYFHLFLATALNLLCNVSILISATSGFISWGIDFSDVSVEEGDPLELKCIAPHPIASCSFEIPSLPKIKLVSGTKNEQYEYFGSFEAGECSIRVFKAEKKHQGAATCFVTYPNSNTGQMATVNVTVSSWIPPSSMKMSASNPYYEFWEGKKMEFTCSTLPSGSSPSNISIYLGIKSN